MKNATVCALLLLTASLFAGCFESDSDGDGFADSDDNCPDISNPIQADYDISEGKDGGNECDEDDDNDGTLDIEDSCPLGDTGWNSTLLEHDSDSDGCRDSTEDIDDDNDGVYDSQDNCQYFPNPQQYNHDNDLLGDECDFDDDNDGVVDVEDDCPSGDSGWTASESQDYDQDGCRDITEDLDDDNDGIEDADDAFPLDPSEWSDFDGDGIGDNSDPDEDNDGILQDACPFSLLYTGPDPGGVVAIMAQYGVGLTTLLDVLDSVAFAVTGNDLGNLSALDPDADGCTYLEDTDFDGDGMIEGLPPSPLSSVNSSTNYWIPDLAYSPLDNCVFIYNPLQLDFDSDGKGDLCDSDIDGDGIENENDWYDYGNGMVSFSFTNFSVWSGGNYDSGGGLPDVYPYIGIGSWDGTQCNDMAYNENYLNYVEEDAYQLENWITIHWDVPDYVSTVCFSLTMYDEDDWAVDDILDFVPGGNNAMWDIFNPHFNYIQDYQFDNRGENYLSISLEFEVYTWVE